LADTEAEIFGIVTVRVARTALTQVISISGTEERVITSDRGRDALKSRGAIADTAICADSTARCIDAIAALALPPLFTRLTK
jgi:hypothetical protein